MSAAADANATPFLPPVGRRTSVRRTTAGTVTAAIHSLPWIVVVLVLTGVAMAPALDGAAGTVPEEAATTARAFSVLQPGAVASWAWTTQPPLGWIQLGLISRLTGAFDRHELAIDATRETMLLAALVSTVLVFWVCRRLRLSRPAATLAAAGFALAPLALVEHRLVLAENLATPWLLLAVVAATARRWRFAAPAAAVCLGVAALTAPSFLLAGILPVWLLIRVIAARRSSDDRAAARREPMLIAGGVVLVLVCGYLLVVATFTVLGAQAAPPEAGAARTVGDALGSWWALDPFALAVGTAGTIGALLVRRVRPVAVTTAALAAGLLLPGLDVPTSAVVPLLAPAAIGVAAVMERITVSAIRFVDRRRAGYGERGVGTALVVMVLVALMAGVAALAVGQDRRLTAASSDGDSAALQAQRWVLANVPRDRHVVADDATWVALIRAGFSPDRLVRYGTSNERTALAEPEPSTLRAVDYVVADGAFRALADRPGPVAAAFENATVVGSFGTDTARVVVWQIVHGAATAPVPADVKPDVKPEVVAQHVDPAQRRARAAVAARLVTDPRITLTEADRRAVLAGRVDTRVLVFLSERAADAPLTVSGFPADPGTDGADRHRVVISSVDGRPTVSDTAAAANLVISARSLTGPMTVDAVDLTGSGVIVSWRAGEPADLPDAGVAAGR